MITNRVELRKPPACGKIFGLCTKLVKVGINTYYTITTIYSEKKVPLFCYGYILTHYEHVYILEAIHYIMYWVHTYTHTAPLSWKHSAFPNNPQTQGTVGFPKYRHFRYHTLLIYFVVMHHTSSMIPEINEKKDEFSLDLRLLSVLMFFCCSLHLILLSKDHF